MASPFQYFRKHTGLMMAILGAMLMFAFVVADPLMQYANRAGGPAANANEVAVRWNGGRLTEQQLGNLVLRRQVLVNFLNQVNALGYRTAVLEGAVDPPPIVLPLRLPATPEQKVELDVVLTKIYADAAREAGVVVSDAAIVDYLQALGRRKVSKQQMRELLKQLGSGGVTIDFVFDLLRDAMLARNYDRSFAFSSRTVLPEQKWRDWLRVSDRVIVEAAAYKTADFLPRVEDPSDEELAAFFDEHKDSIDAPDSIGGVELPSPRPAFAKPRRIVLQYAKLDLQSEVDRLIDTVTEQEIADYYEENKEQFVRAESFLDSAPSFLGGDEETEDAEAEEGDSEQTAGDEAATSGEDAEDPSDESSSAANAEEQEGGSEGGVAEATADGGEVPEADAAGSDPSGNDPDPAAEADTPEATDTGGAAQLGPFRFAAYQPDEQDDTADNADNASEPDSDDATDEEGDSVGGEAGDEVEYQTLEEARDEIRERIAQEKAARQMPDRMAAIVAPLRRAFDDYFLDALDAQETIGEDAPLPEPPAELKRLKEFAEENGLEFAETAELSAFEFRDTVVGRTIDPKRTNPRDPNRFMPLFGSIFAEDAIELYEPVVTYEGSGSGYVAMIVSDQPRETPTLDEIRPDVVRAWKMQEAAELALAEAEKAAEEAEGKGLSLKDFLAGESGVEVVETDEFSWLTQGQFSPTSQQIPVRLGSADPIVAAGPDFMETVFGLGPGEIGAVLNHDRSIAYVVRIAQRTASREELRADFLSIGEIQHRLFGFGQLQTQVFNAAVARDLLGESDLDWKRPNDQLAIDE